MIASFHADNSLQDWRTVRLACRRARVGRVHCGRLAVATIVAAAVVLSSPFVGEIRAAIRAAFPTQFQTIVSVAVATAVVVALIVALIRVRDRPAWRFAILAASIGAAALYAKPVATGNAEVDVVEHVHF